MVLADCGARVIGVEVAGVTTHTQTSYQAWDRGKSKVIVDVGSADDRRALSLLLARSDIFVDDQREALARIGLSDDSVRRSHPSLVHLALSADGRRAPARPLDDTLNGA